MRLSFAFRCLMRGRSILTVGDVIRVTLLLYWFFSLLAGRLYAQPLTVTRIERLDAINSSAEELMPLLSNNGDTLFFTRVAFDWNIGGQTAGADIWAAPFGNTLGKATNNLPPWNNRENNALIGMHHSGNTVYMLDGYGRHDGVAFSNRFSKGWTKPEVIAIPGISASGFKGFYMAPNYQILLISMAALDSQGEEDLYVSLKQPNGKWTKPKNLGAAINSKGFEISPFLSADEKTLYFASNGQGGLGSADIFVAQRLYDSWDVWTKPINVGSPINSESFDAYFAVYDSIAFLSSTRQGGLADIYQVTLSASGTPAARTYLNKVILTEPEIVNLFGFIFDPLVEFEAGTEALSAKDKELLWFVADKLSARPDVQVSLVPVGDAVNKQKAKVIMEYLVGLNMGAARMEIETSSDAKTQTTSKAGVQLKFYKVR
jgi:hypothetical protein